MKVQTFLNAIQTSMFSLLSLLIFAATINATATTPVLVETTSVYMECTTGMGNPCQGKWQGPQNWKVPTRGYHLSKIDISECDADEEIVGLKLYYDPDVAGSGSTITSSEFGDLDRSDSTIKSHNITKRVKSVKMVEDKGQRGFVFTYKDNITENFGPGNDLTTATPSWELAVCGNFIGLRCNFHQGGNFVVDKLGCCEIYDDRPVTYYSIFTTISSFTYTLHQGIATKTWESTELGCYNELFTVTYVKDGATISQPGWITFSSVNRTFVVSTTDKANIGTYTVTIRGTLQNLNNSSTGSPYYDEFTFTLTVQSDCVNTTLTNKTINNMNLSIGGSNTQDATFADSTATTRNDTAYCGTRTYTFTPIKTFLTIINGSTLQVSSNIVSDVGIYSISMEVKLSDFPSIAGITKTFTVTVTCTVSTLTFSTSPMASKTIEVGIDSQPFTMNYAVTKSPNCAQNPTWSLSPSLAFITKAEDSGNLSGVITINNATLSNVSSNALTLTAQVDNQTATSSFTVIIKDPCSRAEFQNTPAPTHMSVIMPSTAIQTQTVTIKTDVQNLYPSIVCPIQAVLYPNSTFVSLSTDYSTISLNAANISLPNDIGTKTFTLTVDSSNYASLVTDQTYTFNVIVVCTVSSLTISTQPANTNYVLNQDSTTTTALSITQSSACNFSFTHTHAVTKNGAQVPTPSWLLFASNQFTFSITAAGEIGTYTVTTTSLIPQIDPDTGANRKITSSFNIVVVSDCTITTITDRTINNMTLSIGGSNTQDAAFADSTTTARGVANYCGTRTYTFTPSKTFLTVINGSTLQVQSNDVNYVGAHTISMEVKLTDYPKIKLTKTFDVTISCTVSILTFATSPMASKTIEVGVDFQPFSMNYVVIKSPNCAQNPTWSLSPSLSFVTKSENVDNTSGTVSINNATLLNVSSNSMTLTAQLDGKTATSSFTVIIKDPCSRSVFQTTPAPLQNMTVTMPSATITTQTITIKTDVQNSYIAIVCGIQATLTPNSTFVSLSSDFSTISVNAANISLPTDIGTKTFTLTVDSLLYSSLVTNQTYTFKVIVLCTVSSLTIDTQASNTNYIIKSGSITTTALSITQSSACNFAYTYTHAYNKNGVSVTPSWISFASNQFTFNVTDPADIGTYTVITTSEIPQVDPSTGVNRKITSSFNIVVVSDCTITTITDRTINNMTQGVTVAAQLQDVFFWDTKSGTDKSYCGPRIYTLHPIKSFLSISGDTMSVQTNNELDIATHTIQLTVSLTNYPMIASITKFFQITIKCDVQSLSFVSPFIPTLTTLQVGIDNQPLSVLFATKQFPNCGKTVNFSLSSSTDSFMTLTTSAISSGLWKVNGAKNAQHNTYSYTLTGTVDGRTATANFQVFIKDPCSSSVFKTTPNPLTDMSIIMYYQTTETKNQTVRIITDIEQANPSIVCPITAVLTPAKPYISVSLDYSSMILDGSKASDADVGEHTFTLTVNSKLFSAQVTQATYTFIVDLKACVVSDFVFAQSIDNITYMITDQQVTTTAFLVTQANLACNFPITYTETYSKNGSTITRPSLLAYENTARTFRIQTSSKSDIGLYSVSVMASIPQVLQPSGTKEISFTFVVTVEDDCKISQINDRVVNNMLARLNTPVTQDVSFTNTRAVFNNDINHCGQYAFLLSPVHSFLSITGSTMTLSASLLSDAGMYPITLTVSMPQFPAIEPITKSFSVQLICYITGHTVIKAPPAHSTYRIKVDPSLVLPFLVTNTEGCPMAFTVEPETRPFSLIIDTQKNQMLIETLDLHQSGIYPLKLKASGEYGESKFIDFTVEIINVCKTTYFDKINIPSLEILRQDPNFFQDNYIDFSELKTQAEKLGVDCGKVIHSIYSKNQKEALLSWIKVDQANKRHIVNVSKEEKTYFQQLFNHHTELVDYPQIAFDQPFNVTLSSAGFSCLSNPQSTFIMGDPPMQFGIQFINNTFVNDMVLTQIIEPVAFNSNEAEISLPSFIFFDKKTLQFKIQDPPYEMIDKYKFGITLGYKEYPHGTVKCTKTVEVKYETRFQGSFPEQITIFCEEKNYSLTLSQFTDVFGRKAQVDVNLDAVSNFLEFNSNKLQTFVDSSELCTYEGKHKVVIKLTDSVGFSKEINIDVVVIKFVKRAQTESKFVPVFKLPPPKPKIKYVDYLGRVRVEFTRPIVLPTFQQYPEFSDPKFLRQNCTNGSQDDCNKQKRSLAAQKPQQNLKEALIIVNQGIVQVNRTAYPVFDLQMVPGGLNQDVTKLKFQWECVDFKEQWMDFQLNYTYSDDVSVYEEKDLLQVNFIGKEYFKSEDGQILEESLVMQRKEVPQQINPALGKTIEEVASAVGNSSKAIAFGNMLMNFILGGVLGELFAVMTKLQIMLHLLIINVQIPPQTLIFFKGLLGMVTFQIVDLSPYIARMFKLDNDSSGVVNQNMVYLGYQSSYFVFNMGNILIMVVVNFFVLCFIAISPRCQNEKIKKARDKIRGVFIWNGIYKGINEPYVVYVISCFTQANSLRWGETGQRANNVIMFLYLIVIVLLPLWTFVLLMRNKNNLRRQEFKNKFFSIYEQLNYKKGGAWTLAEPSISSLRMLFTCASLLFLQKYRIHQFLSALFMHYFIMIYNGQANPFNDRMFKFFQNLNEFFVFIVIMNLFCFADVIPVGPQSMFGNKTMGYALMVIVSVNLVLNFSYIMGKSIKQSCRKLRIKYLLWRRKKLSEALETLEISKALQQQEQVDSSLQFKGGKPLSPHSRKLRDQFIKDLGMSPISSILSESYKSSESEADLVYISQKSNDLQVNHNRNELLLRRESFKTILHQRRESSVTEIPKRRESNITDCILNISEPDEIIKPNQPIQEKMQKFQQPNIQRKQQDSWLMINARSDRNAYQDNLIQKRRTDRRQERKKNDPFSQAIRYGNQPTPENPFNGPKRDYLNFENIVDDTPNAVQPTPVWSMQQCQDAWAIESRKNANQDGFDNRSKHRTKSQDDQFSRNSQLITSQATYVQPSEDRDSENHHSSIVQKRESEAINVFYSELNARLLFDQIWKDNTKQTEAVLKTQDDQPKPIGLISIKKFNGSQNTGVFYDFYQNNQ